ncbi:hypothetical protein Tco_1403141 [Tanacetum coccineum]
MAPMALSDSESNLTNYKRGLASVEERLVFYKKNEVMFYEQIAVLKRDITYKDSDISVLKCELEKLKKEKESNKLKLDNFENAFKSLDKLIESQISDNSRKGVGFEFQQPEFKGYGPKTSKNVSEVEPKKVRKNDGAPIIEDWVSDDEEQDESKPKSEKKTGNPETELEDSVRLNSPEDKKRARAELTQENDKSQYKKCLDNPPYERLKAFLSRNLKDSEDKIPIKFRGELLGSRSL